MRNKSLKDLIYIGLLSVLFIFLGQSCNKDEPDTLNGNDSTILSDSLTVTNRNGTTYPIAYLQTGSITYHQKDQQEAFNLDSLAYRRYVRGTGYTKSLGTLDPSYSNKPARIYHVTYKFKDSTSRVFPEIWIKDTTATNFTIYGNTGTNLFKGPNKHAHFYKTSVTEYKYDWDYQKWKHKYQYDITIDTVFMKDVLSAKNTGTVFWFKHKM